MSPNRRERSASREWLTDGEIRSLIDEHVGDRLEHLSTGAQASINTATLLFGNEQWKIKGFVEETREQLAALKSEAQTDRALAEKRHSENTERMNKIEECAHPIRKFYEGSKTKLAFVRTEWKIFAGCCSALGLGYSMPQAIAMMRRVAHYLFTRHGN